MPTCLILACYKSLVDFFWNRFLQFENYFYNHYPIKLLCFLILDAADCYYCYYLKDTKDLSLRHKKHIQNAIMSILLARTSSFLCEKKPCVLNRKIIGVKQMIYVSIMRVQGASNARTFSTTHDIIIFGHSPQIYPAKKYLY